MGLDDLILIFGLMAVGFGMGVLYEQDRVMKQGIMIECSDRIGYWGNCEEKED